MPVELLPNGNKAEELMANRAELKRSVLLVAFGAEEQGLLGSKYLAR